MSAAWWVTGDTLSVLRKMPDASVDMVMTSPPFLALRSYLPADDPAKADEIGQEATPGEFLDVLLDITEELRRVLAPHGSICVELGDTYSGSGGAGGDYSEGGLREGQQAFSGSAAKRARDGVGDDYRPARSGRDAAQWPNDKSLCLIPELYRLALAYGRNPLTGRETPRWRVRNVVRWARPNPPVGALGDKFRPATSDMVIACGTDEAGRARYFDLDAVREAHKVDPTTYTGNGYTKGKPEGVGATVPMQGNPAGAPPLDWWEIPTAPYKGSHYATYPPALCERPIKAMCPPKVCTVCGEPSRRITEQTDEYAEFRAQKNAVGKRDSGSRANASRGRDGGEVAADTYSGFANVGDDSAARGETHRTVGWTDCGHDSYRNGRVLDIFGGSGTTLAVATGHGRDAIGVDLDKRNADLARERVGMWLTEVTVEELNEALS